MSAGDRAGATEDQIAALREALSAGEPDRIQEALDPIYYWVKALDNGELPEDAATEACQRRVEDLLPALVPLLSEESALLSGTTISILRRIEAPGAIAPLCTVARQGPHPDARQLACHALRSYADVPRVGRCLLEVLRSHDALQVRTEAANGLTFSSLPEATRALEQLAWDDPTELGEQAISALAWKRSDRIPELLSHALPDRRHRAVRWLGTHLFADLPERLHLLRGRLADPDREVREAAEETLSRLGAQRT